MRIDRKAFYDRVRKTVFKGGMKQSAVDALNAMIDEFERRDLDDTRFLAYAMATVRGECGAAMKPVPEIGKGRGKKYGKPDPRTGLVYYGRGWPQLTWFANYLKQEKKLGIPLTTQPDLMLKTDVSAKVLFGGMVDGDFTGKKLRDYFTAAKTDWVNARRIINGLDKAATFAKWARQFHEAIVPASTPLKSPEAMTNSRTVKGAGAAAAGGAAVAVDQINDAIDKAKEANGYLDWHLLGILIGVAILAGAVYAIYARWDDAGRPTLRQIFDRWFQPKKKAAA